MCEPIQPIDRLLYLAKLGGQREQGELFEHCRSDLTLLARSQIGARLRSKADSDDLVQEVFLDAHRQFRRFRGDSVDSLMAWLKTILDGHIGQLVRRYLNTSARNVRLEMSLDQDLCSRNLLGETVPARHPCDPIDVREELCILAQTLEKLPVDYREVIVYRMFEGKQFSAIAICLGRSEDSVQKLWVRGLETLRQMMS